MIYKGDIVRLRNPYEPGLKNVAHMYIVENVSNETSNHKRRFAVCTTHPFKLMKEDVPFLSVHEYPFVKEETYIRLDPMFAIKDVKINSESRIDPPFKLKNTTEHLFFKKIVNASEELLDSNEFIRINKKYSIPIKMV